MFLPLTPFLSGAASSFIIKGIVSDADLGGLDAAIAEAVDVALGDTEAIAMLPPGLRQKLENQGKVCKTFHVIDIYPFPAAVVSQNRF